MRPIRTLGLVYDLRDDYLAEGFTQDQVAEFDTENTVDRLAAAIGELGYDIHRVGNGRGLARRSLPASGGTWSSPSPRAFAAAAARLRSRHSWNYSTCPMCSPTR